MAKAIKFQKLSIALLALVMLLELASSMFLFPIEETQAEPNPIILEKLKIKQVGPDKFAFKSLSGDLIEIGEERHSPLQPYLKLNKWDGEVSLKVNVPYGKNGTKSLVQNKLRWTNDKYDVDFYPIEPEEIEENGHKFFINEDGGVEFDVILKEKPESNIFEFPIETKGLEFYYQSPLTDCETPPEGGSVSETEVKDKDGNVLVHRPENVVGSYAVYHESKKGDYSKMGGKNYMAGKAFHIYRPKIIDSAGREVWAQLNIENGLLTITIDQEWLDKAIYPVRIDPKFGYEGTTGSEISVPNDDMYGSLFTSPADADTATSISFKARKFFFSSQTKGILVLHSNLNIVNNGIGTATVVNALGWYTSTFATSPSLSPNTEYVLMIIPAYTLYFKYDDGSTDQGHIDATNSFASPQDPTGAGHNTRKYFVYCTYEAGASPGITVNPTSGLTTTEAGGEDTFTIVLDTQPTHEVSIGLSSDDTTEGTVLPVSVTFTLSNWSTPQTVTATGVNDDIDDGNIAYNIITAQATSDDSNYSAINPSDVSVTNTDDDIAPSWQAGPTDEDEGNGNPSTAANPTNVGSNVKFEATGDDSNSAQYYLSVCKTAGITPQTNNYGDCGASDSWCYSSVTNNGVQASCTYTTTAGDAPSKAWHAYLCDHEASSLCSLVSTGTGDSGTPFYVNQIPVFTNVTDCGTVNPGVNCLITATASDSDGGDTVSLYVCKAADFDGTACGVGGTWCSDTGAASNPSCNANAAAPAEGAQNYYPYIVDNHGSQATGAYQGGVQTFTVNNVAPVISGVKLNNDADMTLTQAHGDTPNYTNLNVTGTITDNNGCADIVEASTKADAFVDDIAHAACNADAHDNNNNCYALTACTLSGCGGGSDLDVVATCAVGFLYHADPTVANTPEAANKWTAYLNSADEALSATSVAVGTPVEMNDLVSLDVTTTIPYGSLAVGAIADGTALPQTTTVTAKGNTGLDVTLYGVDMTGAGTIAVGKQKYAATAVTYGTATALLVTPGVEHELNCLKNTGSGDPKTKNIEWGLQIPDETPTGAYNGTNTFTGLMTETGEW